VPAGHEAADGERVPTAQTPTEFLARVREAYAQLDRDEEPDRALLELTRRDLEKLGVELAEPGENYGLIVAAIADEIAAACSAVWGCDLTERCAIGPLRHPAVNARCFKGPGGIYALVIHHGLMNLLHKYTKLIVAAHDPSQVTYCNRKDPASLTSTELLGWAEELRANYLASGATRGALLKLSPRAAAAASPIVHLAETFVLGHEAGHYLGGHLEDDARFTSDEEVPWLHVFAENVHHADEFDADAYGFEIMKACAPSAPPETVHVAVVGAFSAMALAGGDVATASHPASSERYQRLAERFGLPDP
jgi:uncharacterized protein YjiS (DUF1127 family)